MFGLLAGASRKRRRTGRYGTENGNDGTKPHTPDSLEADCLEIFDTGGTLLATLGYPLFEPVAKPVGLADASELFYCKRGGTDAKGEYTSAGFVVLKGSRARLQPLSAFERHAFAKMRAALIEQGTLQGENGALVFKDDVLFMSPSGASSVVCGGASNGWREWRNAQGGTLDELKRSGGSGDE